MGVPRHTLPEWDDLPLMVAQLATQPLLDDAEVATWKREMALLSGVHYVGVMEPAP